MTTSSANYFMLRYAIALALIAPFAASDRAEADGCSPATPADNTTVACTGTTTNQDNPNGFGTGLAMPSAPFARITPVLRLRMVLGASPSMPRPSTSPATPAE
jgi:hypothetical protein